MFKKEGITNIIIIATLLSIIFLSPQISDFLSITGRTTIGSADLNLTIGNQAIEIPVINISGIAPASVSVLLDSYISTSYTFVACDADGNADINYAAGNYTGEADFYDSNISCATTGWTNTTCKQFNCSMNVWYFYKAGSWNSSFNVTDGSTFAYNNVSTVTLGSTKGLTISPSQLQWSGLNLNQFNATSSNDPIVINNTGNAIGSIDGINITAYDLVGEDTITEYIPTANFSIGNNTDANEIECGNVSLGNPTTALINETATFINNSILTRGNHSAADDGTTGQEYLYVCLTHVPTINEISAQSYSSENSQQWVVGI